MKSTIAKSVLVALVGAGVLVSAIANAQTLYRWVDKDGKVQYSDMPPPANAKNSQQKRLGDNLIEQDKLPYALRMASATSNRHVSPGRSWNASLTRATRAVCPEGTNVFAG